MASDPTDHETRRKQLLTLLAELDPGFDSSLTDDTPLISSGLIESMTLLQLALWVEDRIDSTVDITSFDLVAEWDTVTGVLRFIERHRAPGPPAERRERP